ncbi:hypothetical protein [Natribacillus halophilus]|uniref:Uncharacterized protein n=1 Tax=Natribacillus halophilus TaxID=549003 RepID=A0A1G8REY6_9BACI|nr:hypothetical protein [Natribacillus halophilus]SDJ15423.1 hypothetical protein SAMN04488123_11742 [Natribacillus halophilus]
MVTGYMYFISFFSISLGFIYFIYFFTRYKGNHMVNMTMTMALAMAFGLSLGFFFGIVFHGHLLYSTLGSITFAGITGFILGIRLHVLASIEGLFSDLMAGRMGAMIVEMLTISEGAVLLLISLLLLIGTTMFCMRHVLQETLPIIVQKYDYLLLVVTCLIMLLTFWTYPFSNMEMQQPPQHEEDHHIMIN